MKRKQYVVERLLFVCLIAVLGIWARAWGAPDGPMIAGTSMMAAVLEQLFPEAAPVRSVAPGAMCPGHYDLRPSDIEALSQCSCLVLQPWQRTMPNVSKAVQAAGLSEERIQVVDVPGSWMSPPVYSKALLCTAEKLSPLFPEKAAILLARAGLWKEAVLKTGKALKMRFAGLRAEEIKVLCNEMQADLLKYFGFSVSGTFARGEDLSVGEIARLIQSARDSGVALVVENLQSGTPAVSQSLAQECGAAHVVLTNFPGGFEGTATWEAAITRNAVLLEEAVRAWRGSHE